MFSTWKFDYTEEETDKLIRLAKGTSTSPPLPPRRKLTKAPPAANFKAGEQQLKTLIKGVWLRKRKQRLEDEAAEREQKA